MNTKRFLRAVIAILSLAVALPASAQACRGDINADGRVDGGDLGTVLAWWGPVVLTNPVSVACDLDNSGQVDGADLGLLLSNWGVCAGTVTSVYPLEGCVGGGTQITITGSYLESTSSVTVGGTPCTGVIVRSANQVEATVPPGAPGSAEIRLVTAAGTLVAGQTFGYLPASISAVAPSQGCVIGGTSVTITGSCLEGASTVTVGGVACPSFNVVSPTTITAVTPAGAAGPAEIRVVTAASTAVATAGFTYLPPSVSSIVPSTGVVQGGKPITITGSYLGLTTSVSIGGSPCTSVAVVDASTVTAVTPPGVVGNADLVISGGKGTVTVPGGYRYVSAVPSWATLIEAQPNPAVVTNPELLNAITATGLAWRVRDVGTGIEMLLVPPGTFQMGCAMGSIDADCFAYELPVHQVTLTNSFYLARYEVTQAQWTARMGSNPSYHQSPSPLVPASQIANRPVESVWNQIPAYLTATGMRLPTEAEWEYACRAGTETPFYNGSADPSMLNAIAWWGWAPQFGGMGGTSDRTTQPVGGKAPNALGFYDMLGNAWEMVSDWFEYYPSSDAQTNPTGPATGPYRVCRGGGPTWHWNTVRSSARNGMSWLDPQGIPYYFYEIGFRVARNP